ncbi:MAG: SEC-C metal-binding domain-containing protein [Candidatus Altiarchaeota archaeon]
MTKRAKIGPADELMEKFVESGLYVEKGLVEEIVKRGDVHAALSEIMREDRYWDHGWPGDAWSPYHVFFILGLKGGGKSFETLEYAVRNRVEELGDYITEDLQAVLYNFGPDFFDKIKAMAFDTSLDMFVRSAAMSALCAFAATGKKTEEDVAAECKRFLAAEKDEELVALCIPEMAEVQEEELFDGLRTFHKCSNEAKRMLTREDLMELHAGTSRLKAYTHCTKDLWGHFSHQSLQYLDGVNQSYSGPPKRKIDLLKPLPATKKPPKVGRNDPCPCGSGVKYKKCCGKISTDAVAKPRMLQLKIMLDGLKPPVWRRFIVEDSISFKRLHEVIQAVMGWDNYHLYSFQVDGTYIEGEEEILCVDGMFKAFQGGSKAASPKKRLNELIREAGQKFSYTYDFGDNWQHTLSVEKIMEKGPQKSPVCIAGERACPPEDCGSVWGYIELMEIRKNRNHPQYEESIVEWLGEEYDPEHFSVAEANKKL